MKKVFVLMVITVMLIAGCKKDEEQSNPEPYQNVTQQYMAEYGVEGLDETAYIPWTGGNAYSYSTGIDTSQIFFHGFRAGKMWMGGYEKSSKRQIFNYTFPELPPKEFTVHKGYGEYLTVNVNSYSVPQTFNDGNNTVVAIYGLYDSYICYSELYFFNGNTLKAKHILPERETTTTIIPWVDNTVLVRGWYYSSDNSLRAYSLAGDSLFHGPYTNIVFDKETAINVNELVDISNSSASRYDLITGETAWNTTFYYTFKIPSNARIDNRTIEKNGNEWTITWYYTEYNGTKNNISVTINIDTGEILSS